jgi:hypothetical protein
VLLRCLAKQPASASASAAALAEALEALPPAGDWTRADATAWWERFRTGQAAVSSASAALTLTITVDLGSRDMRSA